MERWPWGSPFFPRLKSIYYYFTFLINFRHFQTRNFTDKKWKIIIVLTKQLFYKKYFAQILQDGVGARTMERRQFGIPLYFSRFKYLYLFFIFKWFSLFTLKNNINFSKWRHGPWRDTNKNFRLSRQTKNCNVSLIFLIQRQKKTTKQQVRLVTDWKLSNKIAGQ